MGTQDPSCGGVDNMSTSVETDECISSLLINFANNRLTDNNCGINFSVKIVQETSTDFLNVVNVVSDSCNCHLSKVICLSTWIRVKSASIKQNNIIAFFLFLNVFQHSDHLSLKFIHPVVYVVKVLSFWETYCVIKDWFCCLCYLLGSCGNLVIQIIWRWTLANFSNCICRNTPWFHGHNPLIQS